jgi:Tfp pilus assembly protein PilO
MPTIRRDRAWLLAGGVLAVLVVAIGYLFFVSPQYTNASDLRSQASDAIDNIAIQQKHLNDLAKQNANLSKYQAQLAADHEALPTTTDVPTFLRTLQTIGSAAGVSVTTLAVGDPAAVTAAAAVSSTASSTATSAAHAGVGGGVYQITISLTVNGSVAALDGFLQQLQSEQPRAVLITSVSFNGSSNGAGGGTTLALSLQAFMAPASG